MQPKDELRIIKSLIPDETYHISIQEKLEKEAIDRWHKEHQNDDAYKELYNDKISGILGG